MNQPPGGNGFPPGPGQKPGFGQTQLMPGSAFGGPSPDPGAQYGQPPQPQYGQPPQPQFGQPPQPQYGQPPQPQYGQPPQPQYGAQPGYDPNAGQGYGQQAPAPGGYGAAPAMPGGQPGYDPNAGGYGQAQPGYGQPGMGAPGMGAPGMGAPGMGAPGMGAPGMGAPGMGAQPGYGQPPAGGMGNMQVGIGGMSFQAPTIGGVNLGGGDFSKDALLAAVVQGNGFESPRKVGGAMFGLGFLFFIINTVLILAHFYYPYLYSIGAIFWWGGLWLLITGQPRKSVDGSKAPMWARAGLGVCMFIGLIVGILAIIVPWEPTGG
jgi:hypothetical protein